LAVGFEYFFMDSPPRPPDEAAVAAFAAGRHDGDNRGHCLPDLRAPDDTGIKADVLR
jgi:hypothetical protein